MKKMKRIAVSLAMALTMLMSTAMSVSAAAPTIEDIEHKGSGRMEVEFYGKVVYKNAKVSVKDTAGRTYKVKNIRKDNDEVKFTISGFKTGRTYKITISGVKRRGTSAYGKRTGKITIPAPKKKAPAIAGSKAVTLAKNHAAKAWKAGSFWDVDVEKDRYAGQSVWEVDFNGKIRGVRYEFEYKVAVNGGKILKYKREIDD